MKFSPHRYQQYCIDRIVDSPALGLFLDMGLGKTVITLTGIYELRYNRFQIRRALVIAPKKVAEATWSKEAAKWDHLKLLRVQTVLGASTQRVRALNTPADVYIVSRDNVTWLVDYYRHDWPFDMVILDESSSFKNWQAKRFKSLKLIRPRIARLLELTGTPAPNGLIDLWAQLFLLDGGQRLGKTVSSYRDNYFRPDKRSRDQIFSYAPVTGAADEIRQRIGDICISMTADDYLTLPDCIMEDIPVNLDAAARKAYDTMEKDLLLKIDKDTIDAGSAATLTNKLLQMCNGAVYGSEGQVVEIHPCKLEAFSETLEQLHGEHALVFYSFQHDLQRLTQALQGTGLRFRVYKGPEDDIAWNAGEVDILMAHPASCAYGLNLQDGGCHEIWFGLTWSLELYQQAVKRLHRQGQQRPVMVHHLVTQGGVDEDVMKALQGKGDTQQALIEALKARIDKVKGASEAK